LDDENQEFISSFLSTFSLIILHEKILSQDIVSWNETISDLLSFEWHSYMEKMMHVRQ